MEDKALAKELDQWISCLQECKQLEESHVKILCDKVRDQKDYALLADIHAVSLNSSCTDYLARAGHNKLACRIMLVGVDQHWTVHSLE